MMDGSWGALSLKQHCGLQSTGGKETQISIAGRMMNPLLKRSVDPSSNRAISSSVPPLSPPFGGVFSLFFSYISQWSFPSSHATQCSSCSIG
ncbi:hypothetical protein Nepgr_010964 [Nepenthes gracilis]|uniref:Uncharacterized protein n=1 Tax=Nepenthes gracilis TaxID=150966 RepID=A0AAD3SEE2_NEPGR|nr:hypothetical protein Nepgr_010964 [Nepenthes gracilis]